MSLATTTNDPVSSPLPLPPMLSTSYHALYCTVKSTRYVGLYWFTPSDEETKKQQMPLAQIREAMAACNRSSLFSGGAFGKIDLKLTKKAGFNTQNPQNI